MPLSLPSDAVRKITTSTYAVSLHDELLLVTPSGETTITLYNPTLHDCTGKEVIVRNMGSTKIYVTSTSGVDVDGVTTYPVEPSQCVTFKSDGLGWWVSSNDDLTHQIVHQGVSGTVLIDWELGKNHVVVLTGTTIFNFFGGKPGGHYNLIVWQNAVGGHAYSFGEVIAWSGNVMPDQTTLAGTVDLYAFYFDGETFIGAGSLYTIV